MRLLHTIPLVALLAAALLPACAPATPATYDDPWAYCAAAGTIDAPDARYTGPALPDELAAGLQEAIIGAPATPSPPILQGSHWRCAEGAVLACTVGANLPCTEKANTSQEPTEEMEAFCEEQPDAEIIPAFVTGHNVIHAWSCEGTTPTAGEQFAEVDAQGYIADIWYEIPKP